MCKSAMLPTVFIMLIMLVSGSEASAQDMTTAITYQGRLSDAGRPAQGEYDFIFSLFYDPDDPATKYFHKLESVAVEGGLFTVELNFGFSAFSQGDDLWLGVYVRPGELADPNEYTELLPRRKLTATPYAIYAGKAGEVAYGGSVTGGGATNYLPKFTGTYSVGNSLIYEANGKLGIGTTNPDVKLDVHNNTSGGGIYTESTSGWALHANTFAAGGVSVAALSSGGDAVRAETAGVGMAILGSTSKNAVGYFNGDVIVEGGDVGIGTTNPDVKLDVHNNTGGGGIYTESISGWALHANTYAAGGVSVAALSIGGDAVLAETAGVGKAVLGSTSQGAAGYFEGVVKISKSSGPHLIIHDSNFSNDRPGIQFTNNNIHYLAGDDGSDESFGFYSQYGNNRTNDAYVRVYGSAANNWGTCLELSHDGTDGRIKTDVGDLVLEPAGYVGINTSAPRALLEVSSSGVPAAIIGSSSSLATGVHAIALGANADATSDYAIALGTGTTASGLYATAIGTDITVSGSRSVGIGMGTAATITANNVMAVMGGSVGIGTTGPSHLLHVNGIARSTQSTWATSSDGRVKENIVELSGSLDKLLRLRPVCFEYTPEYQQGNPALSGKHLGFVAQEVKSVIPEMVSQTTEKVGDSTLKDFHLLDSGKLIPLLVQALQEQQRQIETLQAENELWKKQLETENLLLKQRLEILEKNLR